MEVLAFFLTLYFRTILIAAHGNTLLTTASSRIEPFKVLPPDKEAHIMNYFPITEPDFLQSPNIHNILSKTENGVANCEILLESPASFKSPSLANSFLSFEENSALKDFSPSVSQSARSSLPTSECSSFSNDFSVAKCMSKFKELRDSIEAYTNLISSSNSVFKLPMAIKTSGDSISQINAPFDSFTTPGSFNNAQPPCVQMIDTISPRFNCLNFTGTSPSCSQSMFPAFTFPSTIETCESPLISRSSDLLTHAPCVKSLDTFNPDSRLFSDSYQSCSQSVIPLLDFPRNIETSLSPAISSSQSTIPVFDFPIETGQFSTLSQCTKPINCLPTVSSLSTVNLSPNFMNFDSFPSFSSSSAVSLPISVDSIDCKSCSLCPLPHYSYPTFSKPPFQEMINDCIVSTPNTLASPVLPISSSFCQCSSPLTASVSSPPVLNSFVTDDFISNECPKVQTTSSLPLTTELGSRMISVKNLLPSSNGVKSNFNSLAPAPLVLPSSLPKLPLETTSFPLLPKSPISLFNNSLLKIPDHSNRLSIFDNLFQSLVTPISPTHAFSNLSLPSANNLTPNLTKPSFSCLTPPSMVPIPSSLSHNSLLSTAKDLPSCYNEPSSCNICGPSIVSDQRALETFSHVPFSNFLNINMPNKQLLPEPNAFLSDQKSEIIKNNDNGDCSFLSDILSMICEV